MSACADSKYSDQTAYACRTIKVFTIKLQNHWILTENQSDLLFQALEVLLSWHEAPSVVCWRPAPAAGVVKFSPLAQPASAVVCRQGQQSGIMISMLSKYFSR